jgi:signal transduction histidine kinase
LQAIGRDITRLKQSEQALLESETRLSLIFNNTSDLQILLRVEPNGRLVAQTANRAYEAVIRRILPDIPYNVIGRDRAEYLLECGFPPELIEAETRLYRQAIESHSPVHYDTELPVPGGGLLALDISIEPILNIEGQCTHVLWLSRDVTERKQAEKALKEYSEQLETMVADRTKRLIEAQEQLVRQERLAVLGQLAGGVAHELRNPLGVLNNAAYFLKLTLAEADETTREYLDIIASRVYDAEKIITDLLHLSRTQPTERYKVAIADLVNEVFAQHPPPEQIEVITDIPINLPPVVVDPSQIEQVLTNLIINAYQAMKDNG